MPAGYYRGFLLEANTSGVAKPFVIRDADTNATHDFTGPTEVHNVIQHASQSQIEYSFLTPFVAHMIRYEPTNDTNQIQIFGFKPLFDSWPELSVEASPWMDVQPGGAAGFLQGFIVPIESVGQEVKLTLKTDVSTNPFPVTAIRTPIANVKTPVPFSLDTPLICHQVQIIPLNPIRIWYPEIQWISEATPEAASTWATQPTSHGMTGFQSILRIEPSYTANQPVALTITAFDGTSPIVLTLPGTSGAKHKILMTPTFNKGMLYSYSAFSEGPFQIFNKETTVWVGQWGRSGRATSYKLLGGQFDDKAMV